MVCAGASSRGGDGARLGAVARGARRLGCAEVDGVGAASTTSRSAAGAMSAGRSSTRTSWSRPAWRSATTSRPTASASHDLGLRRGGRPQEAGPGRRRVAAASVATARRVGTGSAGSVPDRFGRRHARWGDSRAVAGEGGSMATAHPLVGAARELQPLVRSQAAAAQELRHAPGAGGPGDGRRRAVPARRPRCFGGCRGRPGDRPSRSSRPSARRTAPSAGR